MKRRNSEAGRESDEKAEEKLRVAQEEQFGNDGDDGTATGTFAVLRKYDLSAAAAALTARNGAQYTGGVSNGTDGAADGLGGSESVYQSMYRSVFDRSRTTTPPNALANVSDEDSSTASDSRARRKPSKPAPANVFFIVLRHGHLMLYDSPAQLEVRHVISLAHHSVSLSDDGGDDVAVDEPMTDGDLFIKRTAIVLSPLVATANGDRQTQALAPKPFYLFTPTSILKESFYHALLLASPSPPTPQLLDPHDLIKLQTNLHSTLMTAETRALNAITSRIFLALGSTDLLKDFVRAKIEKKISRVQKPGFITALALQTIDLGNAAPVLVNLRLKNLNISGDVTISCDVRYTGGISLTLAAQARLDLGPRFKARTVDLLLASSLKRLSGHMLVRIKPPPSNRLWFCFDGMPDMEIKIEPVVSSRQITYGFILRQIEERIRAVIAETLVKPNWDDIQFFDTRGQKVRGGIWKSEGDDEAELEDAPGERQMLARKGEKTMSMPVLPQVDAEAESTSSGTETPRRDREAELKRRSVVSLPAQASSTPHLPTIDSEERVHPSQPPRPLRSPSLTSPAASAPSVALDGSSANFDPSVKPPPQKARTWGRRHLAQPPARKEAVDAVREVRDRSFYTRETDGTANGGESSTGRVVGSEDDEPSSSSTANPGRTATGLSTASAASSASASTVGTTASAQSESVRQKKAANLLAAATTATTAAKNWSWNAIQNRAAKNTAGRRSSEASGVQSPQEPMGRGQPLPPPGMPLPGPQREKSLWAGSGFAVPGLSGSMKRKPVLPKRPAEKVYGNSAEARSADAVDEFGDWEENSGDRIEEERQTPEKSTPVASTRTEAKVPPPLPKRRQPEGEPALTSAEGSDAVNAVPSHALDAAQLATGMKPHSGTSPNAETLEANSGEADLDTTTSHLSAGSIAPSPNSRTSKADTATHPPSNPTALPAKPVDPETQPSNSDPEDMVVVAAPVESGRNTPVPAARDQEVERQESHDAMPTYDGDGWGEAGDGAKHDQADYGARVDEDWDDEVEEGMPKASFSRSRDDGFELHQ